MLHRGLDAHVLIYDYRGFGRSEGEPDEAGLYLDGEAALAALRARPEVDPSKVVLAGRSLGGGVTAELALRALAGGQAPGGVVLESTFTSIGDMATVVFPLPSAFGRLVRTRFDNLAKAPRIAAAGVPVVVVHGGADELIPVDMGVRLARAAGVEAVIIERGGHNDAWFVGGQRTYLPALRELIEVL